MLKTKMSLEEKMAVICGVPLGKIVFYRDISTYCCQCGCGMELSAFFLRRLTQYEGRMARQQHIIMCNGNGHKKNKGN